MNLFNECMSRGRKYQKDQNAQYCSTYLYQKQVSVQQFHHLIYAVGTVW